MKTKLTLSSLLAICFMMTSCYTTKIANGNLTKESPVVKVNSVKNHFLIYGLVPLKSEYEAKKYVGEKENYVIQTQHTFVDGLLNVITFGIYNPTTTSFYLPVNDVTK